MRVKVGVQRRMIDGLNGDKLRMSLDETSEEIKKGSQVAGTHRCNSISVTPLPCPGQSAGSAGVVMSGNMLAGKRADR